MAVEKEIRDSLKPIIKQLFLNGSGVPDICDMFTGLGTSTVYNWVKKENWAQLKESKVAQYVETPDILMTALDTMLKKLTEVKINEETKEETSIMSDPDKVAKVADAVSKIVKSIKSLSKDKDYLGSIVFTIGKLTSFMNEQSPTIYNSEFREKLVKLFTGFQSDSIKKYSPKNFM